MTSAVFRFAPSPNGYLHLGHAFSALVNADLARETGGRLLLRIEDIDTTRTNTGFEAAILEDLSWLGLSWEEPVRRQSEHFADYAARIEELKARKVLFPCFCSRGDLRAAVAEQTGMEAWPADPDGAPLYPGTCRHLPADEVARRLVAGERPAWRLDMAAARKAVPGPLSWDEWTDEGVERVTAEPEAWGDVVIARRDVATSYHLSVVLDDALQGITHVVRGRDLHAATAIHRLLQELFGLPAPLYRHHRLVLDEEGRKLSKSAGSQSLRALREAGWTPADVRKAVGLQP